MNNYYNPYINGAYTTPYSNPVDRIDDQMKELNKLKNMYAQSQTYPAPVQNIINTNPPKQIDMEAKILGANENVQDIMVLNKTMFLDESNCKLYIKDVDGTITKTYDIVIPKSPEQLKIETLERNNNLLELRLKEMEEILNERKSNQYNKSVNEESESDGNVNGSSATKSKRNDR